MATAGFLVVAFRSHGYPVQQVSLNDGGVWVTYNDAGQTGDPPVGRFNNPIRILDGGLTPASGAKDHYQLDVLQSGPNVLLIDGGTNLSRVDTLDPKPDGANQVTIKSLNDVIGLGDSTAAVLDPKTGKLWVAPLDDLGQVADTNDPTASVGAGATMAVGEDGIVYAASVTKRTIYSVAINGARRPLGSLPRGFPARVGDELTMTVVGSRPVILDRTNATLAIAGRSQIVRLPSDASHGKALALQQPGPEASVALVSDATTLYTIPFGSNGEIGAIRGGSGAPPASPVRLDGCDYAAWPGARSFFVRSCDGEAMYRTALMGGIARDLVFRVNRSQIVLNDRDSGAIWAVKDKVERVDDWSVVRTRQANQSTRKRFRNRTQKQKSTKDRPPQPKADKLGARLGQSTVLHVLDNDFDPDGDVLAITNVEQPQTTVAHVDVVENGQALKLSFTGNPSGDIRFRYTVDDGRGKSANADVTVHVYPSSENAAPYLASFAPKGPLEVSPGQSVSLPVLTDWRDRDGDTLFVSRAASDGGSVSVNEGTLSFTASFSPGRHTLTYWVSDAVTETKHVVPVQILGAKDKPVAPTALPDVVSTQAGSAVTFEPLANDIPGADPTTQGAQLMIAAPVKPPAGVVVDVNQATGVFTATAERPDTYLLTYTVGFGTAPTAVGHIRLDVLPPAAAKPPVTLPDVAVLRGTAPTVIDPLANDVDPQNALLVLQDATPEPGPIAVAVEQHHWLVIRSTAQESGTGRGAAGFGAITVHYAVSDGGAPVPGEVEVTQAPPAAEDLPPVPRRDLAAVRAGGSTEVSVLGNDTDPESDALSLVPGKLVVHGTGKQPAGSAFAVGDVVRYVAPPAAFVRNPTQVIVDYQVRDSAQNTAIGQIYVSIYPQGRKYENPPNPLPLDARVDAGQQVKLHVPIYNVDPDGDVVTLVGLVHPPTLGRVVSLGPDTITYQAYPDSAGSDQFTYAVADEYGQVGTATVRLTVAPPARIQPPVAADDTAQAAPGVFVHVDVLANDLRADGDPVTLSLAPGQKGVDAHVAGNRLVVKAPPADAAPVRVAYVIDDGSGASSSAVATVKGVKGFDNPPTARDDYVPQVAPGVRTVTVDVLANDDDPDGARAALRVRPLSPGARLLAARTARGGRLVIRLAQEPRIVAYEITDAAGKASRAYVHVPGTNVDRPTLRANLPTIEIPAGGSRTLSLGAYVTDPRGAVRLTTRNAIEATPEGRLSAVVTGLRTIRVSAPQTYHGPGAVTFEVTDAKKLGGEGKTAVLSLPIRVGPRTPLLRCPETPTPVVVGASAVTLDLANVCNVWLDDPSRLKDLTYRTHVAGAAAGITLVRADSTGRHVKVRAAAVAKPGTEPEIAITTGGIGRAATGTIPLKLIAAPPAVLAPIALQGVVGRRLTVDVAQALSSPFGSVATPQIVSVAKTSAAKVDFTGTTLGIVPKVAGATQFAYRLTDVRGHLDRAVTGTVTLRIQSVRSAVSTAKKQATTTTTDKQKQSKNGQTTGTTTTTTTTTTAPQPIAPGAPGAPYATSVGNGQVVLEWTLPTSQDSPIDKYEVDDQQNHQWSCAGSPCTLSTNLANGTTYRFEVRAHNAVDWGPFSELSDPVIPAAVPSPVPGLTATPGDGSVSLSWAPPGDNGRAIGQYELSAAPAGGAAPVVNAPTRSTTWTGLVNGTAYTFRIRAQNQVGWSEWSAFTTPVIPFGKPGAMAAPTVSGADSADAHEKAIQVTWQPADGNGRDITKYTITPAKAGVAQTPVTVGGTTTTQAFTVPNDGSTWTYTVSATNAGSLVSDPSPASTAIAAHTHPDAVGAVSASDNANGVGFNGQVHVSLTIPATNGLPVTTLEWQSSTGGTGSFDVGSAIAGTAETETIGGLSNGTTYTFQFRACNADGCGGWSPSSNAVNPYGPPGAPSAGASASGTTINFSWAGGGGAGRGLGHYEISIDGGGASNVGTATSTSRSYGYSESHSIRARFIDSAGQVSGWSNTASATTVPAPPPPPSISIYENGPAPSSICQGNANCKYIGFQMSHFSPGTRYSLAICDSRTGCSGGFNFTTDGSGNYSNPSYFGDADIGSDVWIKTTTGVESNHITLR